MSVTCRHQHSSSPPILSALSIRAPHPLDRYRGASTTLLSRLLHVTASPPLTPPPLGLPFPPAPRLVPFFAGVSTERRHFCPHSSNALSCSPQTLRVATFLFQLPLFPWRRDADFRCTLGLLMSIFDVLFLSPFFVNEEVLSVSRRSRAFA